MNYLKLIQKAIDATLESTTPTATHAEVAWIAIIKYNGMKFREEAKEKEKE